MVCVPCVIVPVLLLIFRFLIQPILMKFWYRGKKNEEKKDAPELVKECKNGVCTLSWKSNKTDAKKTEYNTNIPSFDYFTFSKPEFETITLLSLIKLLAVLQSTNSWNLLIILCIFLIEIILIHLIKSFLFWDQVSSKVNMSIAVACEGNLCSFLEVQIQRYLPYRILL
ncbi:hypothetical protein TSAR_000922 [Trichomalopsis sarcophagae]|uniref:Uncharacterized protein n=1 Tax=Trichomalopsis sarcophagae TaxID=543379 RepID=A0A232F3E1_9HYME|nr:hypothetical protein TSAR_000922 [Trichomalopsis sarcophagae]